MRTNQPREPLNQQTVFPNQQTNKTTEPTSRLFPNQLTKVFLFLLFLLAYSLQSTPYLQATDFAGSLKGVTITDSGAANAPPTAVISYTKNGDMFDFDASGSSGSDGNITEYKWDFGDGSLAIGVAVSHQFDGGSFSVTLGVVDDKGSIGLTQEKVLVAIADTIGNLVESSAPKYISPTQIWAYKLPSTPGHNGVLKSISITADGGAVGTARRFKLCLYAHDAVNDLPGELIVDSVTVEGIASGDMPQLMSLNIAGGSPQIIAGTQYWVGIQALDKYFGYYKDYDVAEQIVYKNTSVYSWESWGGTADGVLNYRVGKCFFTYEY